MWRHMEKGKRRFWGCLQLTAGLSASMDSKLSLKGNGSCWAAGKVNNFGKSEIPNIWNHRPSEYPGLEGTHKDNKSPIPPSVCWKFDKLQFFPEYLALGNPNRLQELFPRGGKSSFGFGGLGWGSSKRCWISPKHLEEIKLGIKEQVLV